MQALVLHVYICVCFKRFNIALHLHMRPSERENVRCARVLAMRVDTTALQAN